jgi:hypothetical protein
VRGSTKELIAIREDDDDHSVFADRSTEMRVEARQISRYARCRKGSALEQQQTFRVSLS